MAEVSGIVLGVRRYGKTLLFVDLRLERTHLAEGDAAEREDDADEPTSQAIVFDVNCFDQNGSSQGDC